MKRFKARQIYLLFILILSGFLITGCGGSGGVTETGHWLPKDVMSIEVTPPNPSIATTTTQQFMATGIYAENAHFDLTSSVTWSSSNTNVATISNETGSKGLAHALTAGITTITATDTATGKSGYTTLTVTSATLVSIAVTQVNPSIALGTNQQFIATGIYSDATTQNLTSSVTWTSSNTDIATIDTATNSVTKGLATSKAIGGPITITAASGTISGTAHLTVTAATLVSIAVTPVNPSIALGTNQRFIATGTYSDLTTQVLTSSVTWTSLNTDVATINTVTGSIDKGLATSIAIGGPITITAALGTISGTAHLTVTAVTLLSIAVTPVNPSIALGTKQQFIAMGTYNDASTQNLTSYVTWSSSNTTVATISNAADGSNGLATSLTVGGPITITATVPRTLPVIFGTAHLTVTAATLVSIEVTPVSASIALGTTQQFIATGTYTDASTQVLTTSVTWTTPSMDTPVASISNAEGSKGLATSLAVGGPIRIHVIDPATGIFGNAKLTVIAVPPPPPASHLGSAAGFGIMATSAITDVPTSTINGDVSLEPGTSCGLLPAEVNGTIHKNDSVSHQARADLLSAYNYYKTLPPGVTIDGGADLGARYPASAGGIPPGTYTSGSTMLVSTPLVLNAGGDANAVWVFQIGSSLTTNVGGGNVTLLGGANPNNVFWVCTNDATIGVNTIFNGTIITGRDATGQTGATIYGRILAGATLPGTIALDTNTVTVPTP